ncbi:hypothetical protein CROQUDRAFT_36438 [Cronartium quercuum f. sp. fusiforme G11]|uniref:ethanolamine-phosphate cytidylyltransferase n=1 Tax=Cronartium quercuum f. sp. fusiforme G11 TaxID=708437 RepID=A0A9P6TGS9_9BASI|nr:hypothetical protein CROQUDRAFT_36438 [Cronartium quercuum f. sp. fusiforme G11]
MRVNSYSLFHYGHANALRQSRLLGDFLVAGTHSDEEIKANKGPVVLSQTVRVELLKACRWVDEVVDNAPYVTTVEFVKSHHIDKVAHGDDITSDADGHDTYRLVKAASMYLEFKRTTGVSTTDAIGRILSLYFRSALDSPGVLPPGFDLDIDDDLLRAFATDPHSSSISHPIQPYTIDIDFNDKPDLATIEANNPDLPSDQLKTTHKVVCTSVIDKDDKNVVYVHGAFDLFSVEDLNYLKKLSESGRKKVIVGIWDGNDVRNKLGKHCILSFQERVLGVLQCRYVSGVVVPAVQPARLPFTEAESYFRGYSAEATIKSILDRQEEFHERQNAKLRKAEGERKLEEARKTPSSSMSV